MRRQHGFTIVELLIVIIVIGILAALVLVAYSNVTNQARITTLQGDLTQAGKQLNLDKERGGGTTYPLTLAAANSGNGLTPSGGASYSYVLNTPSAPTAYCLQETLGSLTYYTASTGGAAFAASAGNCTVSSGVSAWWNLNGNANDTSGNGANGSASNVTLTTGENGAANAAYAYSGNSSSIATPSVTVNGGSFSTSVWFKTTSGGSDMKLVTQGSSTHFVQVLFGQLRSCIAATCVVGGPVVSDGNWHLAVVTGSSSAINIYLDGNPNPVLTRGASTGSLGGTMVIGNDSNSGYGFSGSIDDVRFYNRTLSTNEITTLYITGAQ